MSKVTAPLVGMHFRPPAKAILAVLPSQCPLEVVPEPDNAFDANALQVFVRSVDIPESQREELNNTAQLFGFSLADILAQERWHLGYVKATEAAHLQPRVVQFIEDRNGLAEQYDERQIADYCEATLSFDSAGKPLVVMELP